MKFKIRTLFLLITLVGFVCWFASQLIPRHGTASRVENAPLNSSCPLSKLPSGAKNVTFSYGGIQTNTYYEFDIDEQEFVEWIGTIDRFKQWPTGQRLSRFNISEQGVTWIKLSDGIGYYWQDPYAADRAENIRYDRTTGRCYYWYAPFYPD